MLINIDKNDRQVLTFILYYETYKIQNSWELKYFSIVNNFPHTVEVKLYSYRYFQDQIFNIILDFIRNTFFSDRTIFSVILLILFCAKGIVQL